MQDRAELLQEAQEAAEAQAADVCLCNNSLCCPAESPGGSRSSGCGCVPLRPFPLLSRRKPRRQQKVAKPGRSRSGAKPTWLQASPRSVSSALPSCDPPSEAHGAPGRLGCYVQGQGPMPLVAAEPDWAMHEPAVNCAHQHRHLRSPAFTVGSPASSRPLQSRAWSPARSVTRVKSAQCWSWTGLAINLPCARWEHHSLLLLPPPETLNKPPCNCLAWSTRSSNLPTCCCCCGHSPRPDCADARARRISSSPSGYGHPSSSATFSAFTHAHS